MACSQGAQTKATPLAEDLSLEKTGRGAASAAQILNRPRIAKKASGKVCSASRPPPLDSEHAAVETTAQRTRCDRYKCTHVPSGGEGTAFSQNRIPCKRQQPGTINH